MATGLFNANASSVTLECNGVTAMIAKDTGVLAAGTAGVSGNDVATIGQLGFSKFYESPEQVVTSGSTITLPHSLGRAPILLFAELICVAEDAGYSIGDVILCPMNIDCPASGTYNGVFYKDATNVYFRMTSTTFYVGSKTGGGAALTLAKWRMVVRAWG